VRWVAIALVALATVAAFGLDRLPGEMRDFEVYWTAAGRALQAEPLYRTADGHYQFKYLPAFAVLTAPAALVPLVLAKKIWFVLSVALLAWLIWLALAVLPQRRRPVWWLAVVVIVAMGKFYGHELVLGQVNVLFGVLVTGALLSLARGQDTRAAALLVAAVVVKPYAVLFLPWIAFVRGPRALVTVGLLTVAVLALPAVLYGVPGSIELHQQWWVTVTESTAPNLTNNDNVSVAGFAAKWLGPGPGAGALTVAAAVVLLGTAAGVVLRRRGLERPEALEGALLLTIIPLVSPQGWDYVFLIATPAVALFANYDDRLPAPLRWATWIAVATIGLSLFDLMGRERYAAFMSWSIITLCFLVLVTALAALRARRIA
jgi:hypothetical protein